MLTPRDPDAFRSEVLRRAARIDKRRRRARVLAGAPAVLALVFGAALLAQRDDGRSTLAAGEGDGALTSEIVSLDEQLPWSVVAGTDGAIWVLTRGPEPAITRIPDEGERTRIALPTGAEPDTLVAGTDEAVWATDPAGSRVLRISPGGELREWATESPPSGSAAWLAGRLWFAEPGLDRITGINTEGDLVRHEVPQGRAPAVVSAGPDGAVWYGSSTSPRIGSVSTSGAVNELDLGAPDERAVAMASGPGPSLWLVVQGERTTLAHVDASANIVGDDVPIVDPPVVISVGPDGRIWYTGIAGSIHQQSQTKLTVRELGRPFHADAWALAPDDSMWAVDRTRKELLRITIG